MNPTEMSLLGIRPHRYSVRKMTERKFYEDIMPLVESYVEKVREATEDKPDSQFPLIYMKLEEESEVLQKRPMRTCFVYELRANDNIIFCEITSDLRRFMRKGILAYGLQYVPKEKKISLGGAALMMTERIPQEMAALLDKVFADADARCRASIYSVCDFIMKIRSNRPWARYNLGDMCLETGMAIDDAGEAMRLLQQNGIIKIDPRNVGKRDASWFVKLSDGVIDGTFRKEQGTEEHAEATHNDFPDEPQINSEDDETGSIADRLEKLIDIMNDTLTQQKQLMRAQTDAMKAIQEAALKLAKADK